MKNEKTRLPSSSAGLTTFYQETKSKLQIPPNMIIGVCIVIVIGVILLNVFF